MDSNSIWTMVSLSLVIASLTILLALFMFRRGWVRPLAQEIEPAPPLPVRTRILMSIAGIIIPSIFFLFLAIFSVNPQALLGDWVLGGGAPDLVYEIQIQDEKTGRPIKEAQVLLAIDGRAFVKEVTDLNGRSILVVDPSLSREHARLIVKSEAYNISSQEVTLIEKGVPSLILLEPNN